jgi:hypothetical protein
MKHKILLIKKGKSLVEFIFWWKFEKNGHSWILDSCSKYYEDVFKDQISPKISKSKKILDYQLINLIHFR